MITFQYGIEDHELTECGCLFPGASPYTNQLTGLGSYRGGVPQANFQILLGQAKPTCRSKQLL